MKTTMYAQGDGWIVSSWSSRYQAYELSGELDYGTARRIVGQENCRTPHDCPYPTHDHR